jgi:nicotinamidase-related amidase
MDFSPERSVTDLNKVLGSAVHLCIDMQRIFAPGAPWATPWMERVLPKVEELVAHAPERTVFTRFLTPRAAQEMPGIWQAYYKKWEALTRERIPDESLLDLVPSLGRFVPPAHVFDKFVYSAFATRALHEFLRQRRVDTLIVSGSETDVCVLSTVLNAIDLGYRVVIARDAICSSSDKSHDAVIGIYHERFDVQIVTADTGEILRAWPKT